MQLVPMTLRLPTDLHERLVAHRDATGVPVTEFIRRATATALDEAAPPPTRKPARRSKPSLN